MKEKEITITITESDALSLLLALQVAIHESDTPNTQAANGTWKELKENIKEQMENGDIIMVKGKNVITITKEAFRDVVTDISSDFLNDGEISKDLKTLLPMFTIVIGSKIEDHLFDR